jgi:hypothetical protein
MNESSSLSYSMMEDVRVVEAKKPPQHYTTFVYSFMRCISAVGALHGFAEYQNVVDKEGIEH